MFRPAIDPDLLIYQLCDWRLRTSQFVTRMQTLTMHREVIKKHGLQFVISNDVAGYILNCFPWHEQFGSIGEFRDLRSFLYQDLGRAVYVTIDAQTTGISLRPQEVTCDLVENCEVSSAWRKMLLACVEEDRRSDGEFVIATWRRSDQIQDCTSLTLIVNDSCTHQEHEIPLMLDLSSWSNHIDWLDFWPDITECVRQYGVMNFRTTIRSNDWIWSLECTEQFLKSVDEHCQAAMRGKLVRAIAKKIYGLYDHSLRDEVFRDCRRFRIDPFWRVHYRQINDTIVLDEFGPHDIGMN